MTYQWTPRYHTEAGAWYCEKLVYMSVAEELGEFETEQEAQKICDELNDEKREE